MKPVLIECMYVDRQDVRNLLRLGNRSLPRRCSSSDRLQAARKVPRHGGKGRRGPSHLSRPDTRVSRNSTVRRFALQFFEGIAEARWDHRYLRKALFPLHPSLRLAGLLPPLDCPHHLRRDDLSPFREGVVVAKGVGKAAGTVTVDIGQWETIEVEGGENCEVSTRVTVRMPEDGYPIR